MPRNYVRTTQRKSWTEDQLKSALTSIKNGSSIRKAGKEYGIPESTLRDKLKLGSDGCLNSPLGRKPTFDKKQEEDIANHIIKLANMFYGLTPIELRKLAYEFAEQNNIKNMFNKEKKVAGYDWLCLFTKRNPGVKLREPDNTSINRICAFNKEEVKLFYDNLKKVFENQTFPPHRIYNVDETGISNVQKKSSKIYAKKGQKRVGAATSAERGKTITVVCCFNAAGGYVPPMLIYPRKRMATHLQRDGPIGAVYSCSNNGWINEELFLVWIRHFIKNVKPTKEDPVLLICDNHASHITLQSYNLFKQNHITVVSIPPHTSHRLQPLDLTFFGPLKGALSREYGLFMVNYAHRKITIPDVAGLLNKAYIQVATMKKGVKGFETAGIYPLNPNKFTDEEFAPAEEFQGLNVLDESEATSVTEDSTTSEKASQAVTETESTASVSKESIISSQLNQTSLPDNTSLPGPSGLKFEVIAPIPKHNLKNKVKNSRKSKKQHSEILTSTPIKISLEEKVKEKEQREKRNQEAAKKAEERKKQAQKRKPKMDKGCKKKKRKQAKEKLFDTDDSDSSESNICDDKQLCDDDELDDVDLSLTDKNNDKCIYCDDFGRDKEEWFRCVKCGFWAHAQCSGWDSPEDYECDHCLKKKK